jgi:hypothetical protein
MQSPSPSADNTAASSSLSPLQQVFSSRRPVSFFSRMSRVVSDSPCPRMRTTLSRQRQQGYIRSELLCQTKAAEVWRCGEEPFSSSAPDRSRRALTMSRRSGGQRGGHRGLPPFLLGGPSHAISPMRTLGLLLLLACMLPGSLCLKLSQDIPLPSISVRPEDPKVLVSMQEQPMQPGTQTRPGMTARRMTDSQGRKYTCRIPQRPLTASQQAPMSAAQQPYLGPSPTDLLSHLDGVCLYRQQGKWTYSFCYKRAVRQLRQGVHQLVVSATGEHSKPTGLSGPAL